MDTYSKVNIFKITQLRNIALQHKKLRELKKEMPDCIRNMIMEFQEIEKFSIGAHGKDVALEIGFGQVPLHLIYLSKIYKNVYGIDLDVVPEGLEVNKYISILRSNGLNRFLKTLYRHVFGINGVYKNEICKQLELSQYPTLNLMAGNVCENIPMDDASVDSVYSSDVFEHLDNPAAVLLEVKRVLKNRGKIVVKTLHWAHFNALHDIALTHGEINQAWPHLTKGNGNQAGHGTYVNTLRISDWISLFEEHFEVVNFKLIPHDVRTVKRLQKYYTKLKNKNELIGFTEDELFTSHLLISATNE